ncbi:unnamed protein product, partial [Heterotrigona itama]
AFVLSSPSTESGLDDANLKIVEDNSRTIEDILLVSEGQRNKYFILEVNLHEIIKILLLEKVYFIPIGLPLTDLVPPLPVY